MLHSKVAAYLRRLPNVCYYSNDRRVFLDQQLSVHGFSGEQHHSVSVCDFLRLKIRISSTDNPDISDSLIDFLVVPSLTTEMIIGCPTIVDFDLLPHISSLLHPDESTLPSLLSAAAASNSLVSAGSPNYFATGEDLLETDEKVTREFILTDDPLLQTPILEMLKANHSLFDPTLPPTSKLRKMKIQLSDLSKPIKVPPRRLSPALEQVLLQSVNEMLRDGIISKGSGSYSSPVLLVRKKDNTYRCCVDYRSLNNITVANVFPLPNNLAILDRLKGNCFFAVLDLRSGFYNMEIEENDKDYTGFSTPFGLFRFNKVSMGLRNAPAAFQSAMAEGLGSLLYSACDLYIDDVVVFGKTRDEFLLNLKNVLDRLLFLNVRIRLDKCQFGTTSIRYLGHIVSGDGLQVDPAKLKAILDYPQPSNIKQLRAFIGVSNYLRQFIKNFASLIKPLTAVTSQRLLVWNDELQRAFQDIKESFRHAPFLSHINYEKDIYLQTDASDIGVGGILFQLDDSSSSVLPVAFASRAFNATQQRWHTAEKETYGIVFSVLSFECFLRGAFFHILTDHKNLLWLFKSQVPKLQRWSLFLMEYDFDVAHIPGTSNIVPDALSRYHYVHIERIKQDAFPIDATSNSMSSSTSDSSLQCSQAFIEDSSDFDAGQVSDPNEINDLIQHFHNSVVGHLGTSATIHRMRSAGLYFDNMPQHVYEYIRACAHCQKRKLISTPSQGLYRSLSTYELFYIVDIDVIGPLPVDAHGYSHIIVFIDSFSRFTELIPSKGDTSQLLATALLQVFSRYGLPSHIHTDNSSINVSSLITEFYNMLDIPHITITPHNHQSLGTVERANKEILKHLRAVLHRLHSYEDWSIYVPLVQRIVNSAHHTSIGCSPAHLMSGGRIDLDRNLMVSFKNISSSPRSFASISDYWKMIIERHQDIEAASINHLHNVVLRRQQAHNRTHSDSFRSFDSGDLVLVTRPFSRFDLAAGSNKFQLPNHGPYEIVSQKPNSNSYLIKDLNKNTIKPVSIQRLIPFDSSTTYNLIEEAANDNLSQQFVVERILSVQGTSTRRQDNRFFLVKWLNYDDSFNSWIPASEAKKLTMYRDFIANSLRNKIQ